MLRSLSYVPFPLLSVDKNGNGQISNLANKWFGESNKLVASVFSLAKKMEPSIIFIDEIDAFLRVRSSMDHEATAMMKAEFMTCVLSLFFLSQLLPSLYL